MVYRNAQRRRFVVICLLWDLDEFAKFVVHNDRRSKTSFSYIRPPALPLRANKRRDKDKKFWGELQIYKQLFFVVAIHLAFT